MRNLGCLTDKFFNATPGRGLFVLTAAVALLAGAGVAHSGPCTAQIAAVQAQIGATLPGPKSGPTFSQTLGAQLHHQPTPQDVQHAEHVANKDGDAAIARARKADDAGDAAGCNAALNEAKRLYDIDQ
ncbi:MAG: hypothetical protein WCA56_18875 [Xanthobacteraceae bacterium]|jgi:hypothetical protein